MINETQYWTENSLAKLRKAKETLGNRTGPNVIWLEEKEDDSKLRVCDYSLRNGIPTFAATLNDWEEGLACLAGKPNSGKSTILVNMMIQACKANDDLIIIDISLDDPYNKRFEQYIAAQTGLFYQEITTKTDLSEAKIQAKEAAEQTLEDWYRQDRLRTVEATEVYVYPDGLKSTRSYRDPENIFRLMAEVREAYPDKKIVFFIDAWNNLDLTKARAANDVSQANYYLGKFQEESNKHKVMVMLSAHLRKGDGTKKKPSLEDIKGTSDMSYNVVWAGLVTNELRERALKNPLVYEENERIYPIVIIEPVKTKVSTWDMPLFYVLKSGQCGLKPLLAYEYLEYIQQYSGPRK